MTAGKVETETITEGDGERAQGPGQRPGPPVDRQRLLPGDGVQHLRGQEGRAAHRQRPAARVPGRRSATPRSARGSRSPRPPRRPSASRQRPARHRQQGHRAGRRRPGRRRCSTSPRASASAYPDWMPTPQFTKGVVTGFDFEGAPEPDRRAAPRPADQGHRPAGRRRARRSRSATSARSSAGQAVRRELRRQRQRRADDLRHRHRRGHQGLGQGARRACPSAPGWCSRSRRTSATATRAARTAGIPRAPHPGLRHRHPGRCLSRRGSQVSRWQDRRHGSREERAAAQPADHAARPAALRRQGADPGDPLPRLRPPTRSRRCSSATRTSCAASASRSRSGRWTRSSTTSPATGSAPTSSRCPTSASPPTRPP